MEGTFARFRGADSSSAPKDDDPASAWFSELAYLRDLSGFNRGVDSSIRGLLEGSPFLDALIMADYRGGMGRKR